MLGPEMRTRLSECGLKFDFSQDAWIDGLKRLSQLVQVTSVVQQEGDFRDVDWLRFEILDVEYQQ